MTAKEARQENWINVSLSEKGTYFKIKESIYEAIKKKQYRILFTNVFYESVINKLLDEGYEITKAGLDAWYISWNLNKF